MQYDLRRRMRKLTRKQFGYMATDGTAWPENIGRWSAPWAGLVTRLYRAIALGKLLDMNDTIATRCEDAVFDLAKIG
jgi:hypothetical protein